MDETNKCSCGNEIFWWTKEGTGTIIRCTKCYKEWDIENTYSREFDTTQNQYKPWSL